MPGNKTYNPSRLSAIYNAYKADGMDKWGSEQKFINDFYAAGEQGYKNRKQLWADMRQAGADVGNSYEEFSDLMMRNDDNSYYRRPSSGGQQKAAAKPAQSQAARPQQRAQSGSTPAPRQTAPRDSSGYMLMAQGSGGAQQGGSTETYSPGSGGRAVESAEPNRTAVAGARHFADKLGQQPQEHGEQTDALGMMGAVSKWGQQLARDTKQRLTGNDKMTAEDRARMSAEVGGMMADVERAKQQTAKDYAQAQEAARNPWKFGSDKGPLQARPAQFGYYGSANYKGEMQNLRDLTGGENVKAGISVHTDPATGEAYFVTENGEEYGAGEYQLAKLRQQELDRAKDEGALMRHQVETLSDDVEEAYEREARAQEERYEAMEGKMNPFLRSIAQAGDPMLNNGNTAAMRYTSSQEMINLDAARSSLRTARQLIREADINARKGTLGDWAKRSFAGGLVRGFGDKFFDVSTWDFGMTDIKNGSALLTALNKADKKEPLTESEQALLDAKSIELAVTAQLATQIGRGYKAGQVTGEMAPFMLEMFINPAAKAGEAAVNKLVRYCLKRFPQKMMQKGWKGAVRRGLVSGTARVAGDIAGSALMTATTGLGQVKAGQIQNQIGDIKYEMDQHGNVHYSDRENEMTPEEAWKKSFKEQWKERGSEMIGGYFAPIFGTMGKITAKMLTSKAGQKVGGKALMDWINSMSASKFVTGMNSFLERTQWHGVGGEYFEEKAGDVLDALFIGNVNFNLRGEDGKLFTAENSFWNLDDNIDTLLGVSVFGGLMSAINSAGFSYDVYRARKSMRLSGAAGRTAFGSERGKDWESFDSRLQSDDLDTVKEMLQEMLTSDDYTDAQRNAIVTHAKNVMSYRGYVMGEAKKEEAGVWDADKEADQQMWDDGYKLEDAEDIYNSRAARDAAAADFAMYFGEEAATRFAEDPGASLTQILENENISEGAKNVARIYNSAAQRYNGVLARINDEIDERVTESDVSVDNVTDAGGNVRRATLTETDEAGEPKQVYIVSGEVVMRETGDGRRVVDQEASDKSIFVKDTPDGKPRQVDISEIASAEEPVAADEAKAEAAQQIEAEVANREGDKLDFGMSFEDGQTYEVEWNGQKSQVTVVRDNGDGTVEISIDGAEPMAASKEQVVEMVKPERAAAENGGGAAAAETGENGADGQNGAATAAPAASETGAPVASGGAAGAQGSEAAGAAQGAPLVDVEGAGGGKDDTVAGAPDAMPMQTVNGRQKPDFHGASAERAARYIADEAGLDEEEQKAFVAANVDAAQAALDKHAQRKPKMGTDIDEYQEKKAAWQAEGERLRQEAAHWQEIAKAYGSRGNAAGENGLNGQNNQSGQNAQSEGVQAAASTETPAAEGTEAAPAVGAAETAAEETAPVAEEREAPAAEEQAGETPSAEEEQNGEAESNTGETPSESAAGTETPAAETAAEGASAETSAEAPQEDGGARMKFTERAEGARDVELARRERMARAMAAEMEGIFGVPMRVITRPEDITNDQARRKVEEDRQKGTEDTKAWYDTATGEVCVYAPHVGNPRVAVRTYLHEVVGHKGLRGLFRTETDEDGRETNPGFDSLCDRVWEMMPEAQRKRFLNYPGVRSIADEQQRQRAAADEYMAHMAERDGEWDVDRSVKERVVHWLKMHLNNMLEKLGFDATLTDDDVRQLIKASARRLEREKRKAMKGAAERAAGGSIGESGARFSTTSILEGAGFEAQRPDDDGNLSPLVDEDGNFYVTLDGQRYDARNPITPELLKQQKNSTLGLMMRDAKAIAGLTDEQADKIYEKYAGILNQYLRVGSAANGGLGALQDQWLWLGETVYRTVATNGDAQYSFSMDITRVCKKNEAVIKTISALQRELGYGITPGQIMDIYLETESQGYQVPCPVCYVFSRYIRNGKYASAAINGMEKYGEHLPGGSDEWTAEQWAAELQRLEGERATYDSAVKAANEDVTKLLGEIDETTGELKEVDGVPQYGEIDKVCRSLLTEKDAARRKELEERLRKLDARYRAALQVVSQQSLTNWIKSFAIHPVKGKWVKYEDTRKPANMDDFRNNALDLRLTANTMVYYPAIQRLRKSGGAAAGKEITFASDNRIGELLAGLGVSKPGESVNYYELAARATTKKERDKYLKKARERMRAAVLYAKRQSLRGGQRMWSWSDNIESLGPDVAVNLMQMQMLGGALQSYSKQLEGIYMVASMGGYVNGSLMAKDGGYRELTDADVREENGQKVLAHDITEEIDENTTEGKRKRTRVLAREGQFVYERDGKMYTLIYDDIIGVDPFGHDGKLGLYDINKMLDKAGNILVGMNDIHVRAAMADPEIFFIIPWHASGQSQHLLTQMLSYLGSQLNGDQATDYTDMQEEKKVDDGGVTKEVVELWEDCRSDKYPCGIEGGIESGDGKNLSAGQKRYRELRKHIFNGNIVRGHTIRPNRPSRTKDMTEEAYQQKLEEWREKLAECDRLDGGEIARMTEEVENDAFLSQVLRKVRETVVVQGTAKQTADNGTMTNGDNKYIYPYEYWDESSTFDTADVNAERYLEYCRRMGVRPKFSGNWQKANDPRGNFIHDKGFWKLLIDRRMYDRNKQFQDLTPVDAAGFEPHMVDPKWTGSQFTVTQVADDAGVERIRDAVIKTESERTEGGMPTVDYSLSMEDAVRDYRRARGAEETAEEAEGGIRLMSTEEGSGEEDVRFMTYGAPYQGSKSRFADKLVEKLPKGKRFVDLFSGGGAVTHAAMLSGKYDAQHMNDLYPAGQRLFLEGVNGEWRDRELGPMTDEEFAGLPEDSSERIVRSAFGKGNHQIKTADGRDRTREQLRRVQGLEELKPHAGNLTSSEEDYRNVKLEEGDVVYADIPYENTHQDGYRGGKFDKQAFVEWAQAQDVPVYVSEYSMPEGWTEVASFDVRGVRGGKRPEKLFVQSKFAGEYERRMQEESGDDVRFMSKEGLSADEIKSRVGDGRAAFMVIEERDADYMDAVEKGDAEKAGRMVREAAKRAGVAVDANGNPIDLYHGTRRFGFTVFDRSKSKLGFFFSTLRSVAGNYGTHDMYAGVRRINKPLKDDGSAESVLHNARSVFSQDWRMATDEEKEAIISKTEAEAKEVAEKLDEYKNNISGDLPEDDEIDILNATGWVEDLFYTAAYARENGNEGAELYRLVSEGAERYNENRKEVREYLNKHYDELDESQREYLNYLLHWNSGDVAIDIAGSYARALSGEDVATVTGSSFLTVDELRDNVERTKDVGAYHAYGKLGDNPLVVDAHGHSWVSFFYNGKLYDTDKLAEEAEQQGYTSVIVKNVHDDGDLADDYIFFNSNQIKSADPVTYDDAGNVIPLSERFNPEKEDIRFMSESEDVFVSNARRAVEGIRQEKASPQQWLAMIQKAGGLKAAEDKWMGLSDWLKEQKAKSLTKDEVLQYIRENQVRVEEVDYGDSNDFEDSPKLRELRSEFDELVTEAEETTGSGDRTDWAWWALDKMVERYGKEFDNAFEIQRDGSSFRLAPRRDMFGDIVDEARKFLGAENGVKKIHQTRMNYTTEGLTNKREIALTVPTIEPWNENDRIHFGDAGGGRAVAWIRFGDAVDADGNRVLVIDEIQSKRHQAGRERGYRTPDSPVEKRFAALRAMNDYQQRMEEKYGPFYLTDDMTAEEQHEYQRLYEEMKAAMEADNETDKSYDVPDAPFEKNWHELALKRMLRYAAENGYDKVAWTKGAQQASRYGLGGVVDGIAIKKSNRAEGKYQITTFDKNNVPINSGSGQFTREEVLRTFGKDLGGRMLDGVENLEGNEDTYLVDGDGLEIGGEGMKGFYDRMLPQWMDKYGKKWGVKTGEVELAGVRDKDLAAAGGKMWSVDVTDAMKESVKEGQVMFMSESVDDGRTEEIMERAKKKFGLTDDVREAGYVLPDGGMLDFSGRNELDAGADDSFLRGSRQEDHRRINSIAYDYDADGNEVRTGVETDMRDFIRRGGIRIDAGGNVGIINLAVKPTEKQRAALRRLINLKGGNVDVDFGDGWDSDHYVEYEGAKAQRVLGDIDRYFDEGIKPEGNVRFMTDEGGEAEESEVRDGDGLLGDVPGGDELASEAELEAHETRVPLDEALVNGLMQLARDNKDNVELRVRAMRSIGGSLGKLRQAMARQREYDRGTVDKIVRIAKTMLGSGIYKQLGNYQVRRLLGMVNAAAGREDITKQAQGVVDILTAAQERAYKETMAKLLKVKGSKLDQRGVEVQAGLDIAGQRRMAALKKGMAAARVSQGERTTATNEETPWGELLSDIEERLGSDDPVVSDAAGDEYVGVMLAQQWYNDIRKLEEDDRAAVKMRKEAEADVAEGRMTREAYREYAKALEEERRNRRMQRLQAYEDFLGAVSGQVKAGAERAAAFREAAKERVKAIRADAGADLADVPYDEHVHQVEKTGLRHDAVRLLLKPLATFDNLLRYFGKNTAVGGRGRLFRRFMEDGFVKATDNEWRGVSEACKELDEKASEVMGKKMHWSGLFDEVRRQDKKGGGIDLEIEKTFSRQAGDTKVVHLTPGQMLYVYMVNKMADGRMKLRKMGISEQTVELIKDRLDPRFVQLADWLQDEYLVKKREKYNEVYERMFGAPMAAIENYFPLKVNQLSRHGNEDVEREQADGLMSTATGSVIKRRVNSLPLDISADAFDVVLEHIQQMEHWAAYAELNRDLNTLLSDRRFKAQVQNMKSARYGSGKDIWDEFRRTCQMVAGTYRGSAKNTADRLAVNVSKGVTGAKIAFRVFTALKQTLSYSAYFTEASASELAKSTANLKGSVKWALENLPMFARRWESRQAGDTRLQDTPDDWSAWNDKFVNWVMRNGMLPNAFVDMCTVAAGAKAIYETKKARYLMDGYSEAKAHEKALNDAAISYNETQQSSEAAFVSTMQVDRTLFSTMLTVFRNSPMAYTRRVANAVAELRRLSSSSYRGQLRDRMAGMMQEEGLTEAQAQRAAKREVQRAAVKDMAEISCFGLLLQALWNMGPYMAYMLLGDDDDEKKAMTRDALLHSAAGSVEGLAFGNVWSDLFELGAVKGESAKDYELNLLPMQSDARNTMKLWDYDMVRGVNDLVNLVVQAKTGANPQTLTDVAVALWDASNGDLGLAREAAIFGLRLINAPQSAIDKVYLDEIGMLGKDAKKLDYETLCKRYANYRLYRQAPLTGILYGDAKGDALERSEKRFERMVAERYAMKDAEELARIFDESGDDYTLKGILGDALSDKAVKEIDPDAKGKDQFKKDASNLKEEGKAAREMYRRLRTAEDVTEDARMAYYVQQARNKGGELKKEVDAEKRAIDQLRKDIVRAPYELADGTVETRESLLAKLRQHRRELIDAIRAEVK